MLSQFLHNENIDYCKTFLFLFVFVGDFQRGSVAMSVCNSGAVAAPSTPLAPAPPPQRYRLRDVFLGDYAFTDDGLR